MSPTVCLINYHGAKFAVQLVEVESGLRLVLYRDEALIAAGLSSSEDVALFIWLNAPYVAGSSKEELTTLVSKALKAGE